jgi:hypothetical protein
VTIGVVGVVERTLGRTWTLGDLADVFVEVDVL